MIHTNIEYIDTPYTINCHNAYEIGLIEMKKIIGQSYGSVKLKRSNRVLPIAIINSSIRIREEITFIDPLLIFQRILIHMWDQVDHLWLDIFLDESLTYFSKYH